MTATTSNTSAPANGEATAVVASHEVGMMFVHEYYTFLNKEPSRLHCFYNKQSTMSHGIQGEEAEVCNGQQDIHAKILALDFEDCKVLVSNVDSQTSLNGGIMIQVLGEMSNRGGPSQKFVQTFFLAEQPKGFYVLNDIFRYLKDDSEVDAEVVEEEEQQQEEPQIAICPPAPEPEVAICPPAPEPVPEPEIAICPPAPEPEIIVPPTLEPQVAICPPAPEPVVEEKKPAVEEKKTEKKEHKKHDKKADKKETKKDAAKKEAEVTEKPKTPEPTKKQNGAPAAAETVAPAVETPVPAPAPVPAEPPKPKTWANLAAKDSSAWGAAASAAKGSSVNISQPVTPKPQVVSQPKPQQQQQQQGGFQKVNGHNEFYPIYVKNITDRISEEQLREALSKFGVVKKVELTQKGNCAYVDFTTADAMHAALKQNKVPVGSEFVFAEERRPRGFQNNNRPPHFQNGNGGVNGHQGPQSGHRGGRPARGGFQDRKPIQRPEKPAPTVAVN